MNVDVENVCPDGVNNSKLAMGSAVSADPSLRKLLKPVRDVSTVHTSVADLRGTIPADLLQVNTTSMAEPARRLLYPDQGWGVLGTGQQPHFPVGPIVNPQMEHLDQWCARPKIPIPMEILPVIKHRMMSSMHELATECPNGERMHTTSGAALVFLSKTGSKKDAQMSLAALSLHHEMYPPLARAGRVPTPIVMGNQMVCIDYSAQPVTLGELSWIIIDFGENRTLGDKLRNALSEGEKVERSQCVALLLAAAYEWVIQVSRRPPSFSRVLTAGMQLRQAEFQLSSECVEVSGKPVSLLDCEIASAAATFCLHTMTAGLEIWIYSSVLHSNN